MEVLKKFEEENTNHPSLLNDDEDEDRYGKQSDLTKRLEAVDFGTLFEKYEPLDFWK